MEMSNTRFQNALNRVAQPVPPIWFMRQAGRYHSHYQELRKKHDFITLCKEPDLATEVAMGPIEDFDFDAAILFSDILYPLDALGMGLSYSDGKGPQLEWHLNADNIGSFNSLEQAKSLLKFQAEAVTKTRARLPENKSLIGFIGGPWTLFAYATQGTHAGGLLQTKSSYGLFEEFCQTMVPLLRNCISEQHAAGAEVVMVFDTAAGELSPSMFWNVADISLRPLISEFDLPIGYYSKNMTPDHYKHSIFRENAFAGLGFDHRWDLPGVLQSSTNGFVQGNFDQALLFSDASDFESHLERFYAPFRAMAPEERAGWICGLGHGVLPKTPVNNVRRLVEFVRGFFNE
jgi:uroporphyrinogen decarboxylase